MSKIEMEIRAKKPRELRRMADELAAEIEAVQDEIKAEMTARNEDTLSGSDWKITWKSVTSSRVDTAALRKALPDVVERFSTTITYKQFRMA